MKKSILVLLVLFLFSVTAVAGIVGDSPYDGVYDIYVTKCDGTTVVYENCVVTNLGQYSIAFIPDQGRIPTGNGKQIIVSTQCATAVLVEK